MAFSCCPLPVSKNKIRNMKRQLTQAMVCLMSVMVLACSVPPMAVVEKKSLSHISSLRIVSPESIEVTHDGSWPALLKEGSHDRQTSMIIHVGGTFTISDRRHARVDLAGHHHGNLSTCPRLKRALRALQDASGALSTQELAFEAGICAVNSVIAELRENGAEIICQQRVNEDGQRRWLYTLIKSPEGYDA